MRAPLYIPVCMVVYIHISMCTVVNMHTGLHTDIHTYIRIYIHACIHTYIGAGGVHEDHGGVACEPRDCC